MVLTKRPLSTALKTFYGVGDMGFSLMTSVELFFFVFFLTNVAKFSLPMVAVIGSVTSIVDAILSPFYGAIISGTKPLKWGRNRSWMLIAPPLVVVLFMFQYTKIGPSELISAAIVCAGFILSHIVWNIAWVGNVSMIAVLATNPEERGLLASRRSTWTAVAGVFFSYIGQPLALYIGATTGNEVLGYSLLAGIMAFLMMLGYWTVFKLTEGYEPTGEEEARMALASPQGQKVSLGGLFRSVVQNPPLIILLIADFFRFMGFFIITAAAAFYFKYVAQNMALFPLYLLLSSIVSVIGAYSSAFLIKKLTTRTTAIFGLVITSAIMIIGSFFAMNVNMFFIFAITSRLFFSLLGAALVALYTDVAVYSEWKTGENATPFVMGMMNLSLKTAIISRGTVIPFVLASVGFSASIDPSAATEALKQGIISVNLLIPGIFALVAGVILTVAYKLTRERVAELQEEINNRKIQAVS